MTLQEVNEAAEAIYQMSHPDANIIFGTSVDDTYGDEIAVTVVATSFDEPAAPPPANVAYAPADAPPPPQRTPYSQRQPPPPQKQRRGFFSRF